MSLLQADDKAFAFRRELFTTHPSAKEIPGKYFTAPLKQAVAAGRLDLIQALLEHPNAKEIPGKELAGPLKLATKANNQDLFDMILDHPNIDKKLLKN